FDVIPGKAYVKGFLRNYAAFLELDPEEILEQYHANFETVKVVVPAEELRTPAKSRHGLKGQNSSFALIGALVFVVAGLAWGGYRLLAGAPDSGIQQGTTPQNNTQTKPPAEPVTPAPTTPQPTTPQPAAQQPVAQAPAAQQPTIPQPAGQQTPPATQFAPVDITLKAQGGICWLNVVRDGVKAFEGNIVNGQTLNFKGTQTITIRFGNAGVVRVFRNGADLGLAGGRGMVVNKVFTK
ncbi:MAG TPA: RodZ domain-containing protein, partial [Bacillota bacterium]|nr:RodZ domain-containing protein [Bacillota bacterium]